MNKWIDVKDILPQSGISIIFCTTDGTVGEGEYKEKENIWIRYRWACKYKPEEVIYWMLLPKIPKINN